MPLPEFIVRLYFKRFGRERPEVVMSIEDRASILERKKAARREAKQQKKILDNIPFFKTDFGVPMVCTTAGMLKALPQSFTFNQHGQEKLTMTVT
jgi:hypothetical protein